MGDDTQATAQQSSPQRSTTRNSEPADFNPVRHRGNSAKQRELLGVKGTQLKSLINQTMRTIPARGSGMRIACRQSTKRIDSDAQKIPRLFEDTIRVDEERARLLNQTRGMAPEWVAFHFHKYKDTALPTLVRSPTCWLSLMCYAGGCVIARTDQLGSDRDDGALDGPSVLITFLVAFYFGHCYNRYYSMYAEAMRCAECVCEASAKACLYLPREQDRECVWRYTNLAHVCGYVGLSAPTARSN
jgi:hypothetical protein